MTRLRLVHFGFSKDPQWDQMYDGVSRGWDFMLWGLKTYLEEHPGVPRTVVFVQSELAQGTTEGAWERVFSREGFLPESARSLKPGGKFNATIGGQPVEGIVRVNLPGRDFQAKIDTFDGALLRVQTDPCKGGPGEEISVTIAEYGGDKEQLRRMHGAVVDQLGAMFGREKLTDRTKMR